MRLTILEAILLRNIFIIKWLIFYKKYWKHFIFKLYAWFKGFDLEDFLPSHDKTPSCLKVILRNFITIYFKVKEV